MTPVLSSVASKRYFPGWLLKNGLRLRMTSTIKEADETDSRNHPVRNCAVVAWRKNSVRRALFYFWEISRATFLNRRNSLPPSFLAAISESL